jgi:hypothetical protein
MSNIGKFPGKFSQETLQSLFIGDPSLNYPGGCAPYSIFPNICEEYPVYPDNGEYMSGPTSQSKSCKSCDLQPGCSSDTSGNGESCQCNGYFDIIGHTCGVIRNSYRGDPAACCLISKTNSDSTTTGLEVGWDYMNPWQYIGKNTYSCDPINVLPNCSNEIYAGEIANKFCRNIEGKDTQAAWNPFPSPIEIPGYCWNYVNAVGNKSAAQTVLLSAVENIRNFGQNDEGYAKVVNNLLQACSMGPAAGICDGTLKKICSVNPSTGQPYTRQDIFDAYNKYLSLTSINPNDPKAVAYKNIFQACGCHLPASQYAEWSNLGINEQNSACDPLCLLPNVVGQFVNGAQVPCNQNICIIDNITVDLINSQVSGGINFSSVCGNCSQGNCRCIFSDINVLQNNSTVSGGINFSQSCGGNCFVPSSTVSGELNKVDCATGLPTVGEGFFAKIWDNIKSWFSENGTLIIIIIVIFVVISLFILWMYSSKPKGQKPIGKTTLSEILGDYDDTNYY